MAQYYKIRTDESVALNIPNASITPSEGSSSMTEFDRHRETLLAKDANEGPASELRRYLATMQREVKKDTDIVEWWQVSFFVSETRIAAKLYSSKEHANVYPTLARIALDVLPSQASSVPCERLFSGTKQIATDRRACLGPIAFEELTIMKSAWGPKLFDVAAWNAAQTQEVEVGDFEQMLIDDVELDEWVKLLLERDNDFNSDWE